MKWNLVVTIAALIAAGCAFSANARTLNVATFAGGCFWCVEADFDKVPGVMETVSGYTGGHSENPTYKDLSTGNTGHHEALKVIYDPDAVTYTQLLNVFWHSIDPVDAGGQFCDRGEAYETAIFVHSEKQRRLAETSKARAEKKLGVKIFTPIEPILKFYRAEDYHQNYYRKAPLRYKFYRWNCGRNQRVRELWGEDAYSGIPSND